VCLRSGITAQAAPPSRGQGARLANRASVFEVAQSSGLPGGRGDAPAYWPAEQAKSTVDTSQPVVRDLLLLQNDAGKGRPIERATVKRNRIPPGRPGRGRRKSTQTSSPWRSSRPHSSRVSRRQASHGVSPSASTIPPGMVHPDLYVGLRISSRPSRSQTSAPADAGILGGTPGRRLRPPRSRRTHLAQTPEHASQHDRKSAAASSTS